MTHRALSLTLVLILTAMPAVAAFCMTCESDECPVRNEARPSPDPAGVVEPERPACHEAAAPAAPKAAESIVTSGDADCCALSAEPEAAPEATLLPDSGSEFAMSPAPAWQAPRQQAGKANPALAGARCPQARSLFTLHATFLI